MKLIPSILADDIADFRHKLDIAARVCGEVQIDVMDGKFVPHKTVDLFEVTALAKESPLKKDIHAMEFEPEQRIETARNIKVRRFIFHFEAAEEPEKVVLGAREAGLQAGLALNPSTAISEIEYLISSVNLVMFLAVNPGDLGSKFIPEIMEKVREFKRRFPQVLTAVDGGVTLETLKAVQKSDAEIAYVGRGIFGTKEPVETYSRMLALVGSVHTPALSVIEGSDGAFRVIHGNLLSNVQRCFA